MAIQTYDLGPGTLKLGSGPLQIEAQLTNCRVEASEVVTSNEAVPVLSGEEQTSSDRVTHTYTLAGNLFQDIAAGGCIDWSWINKGTPQPFIFIPSTAAARQIKGTTYPVPIQVGGDVTGTATNRGPNPRADFTWRAKGPLVAGKVTNDPTFGPVA